MATFTERGSKHRALIRRAGMKPVSKTFGRKIDAERWAREFEVELDKGGHSSYHENKATTIGDLLLRFINELEEGKLERRGAANEITRLNAMLKEPFTLLPLASDMAGAIQLWRDDRLAGKDRRRAAKGERLRERAPVKGQTVARYMKLLSAVFNHARMEWRIDVKNPLRDVKKPRTEGGERDTIWTDEHVAVFLEHFKWSVDRAPVTKTDFIPWVLLIAKETGLRMGNVCGIRLDRIDLSVPHIRFLSDEVKAGPDYYCPLNTEAVRLLRALTAHRKGEEKLIEPTKGTVDVLFRRHKRQLAATHPEVQGLVIHDLRHTWTTKYAPKIEQITLAKISGRASTSSLFRYYNPKAADLAKLLD